MRTQAHIKCAPPSLVPPQHTRLQVSLCLPRLYMPSCTHAMPVSSPVLPSGNWCRYSATTFARGWLSQPHVPSLRYYWLRLMDNSNSTVRQYGLSQVSTGACRDHNNVYEKRRSPSAFTSSQSPRSVSYTHLTLPTKRIV